MIEHPIVIPMEDAPVHTVEHPFCDDMHCPCHHDVSLMEEALWQPVEDGVLTEEEARRTWYGQQI